MLDATSLLTALFHVPNPTERGKFMLGEHTVLAVADELVVYVEQSGDFYDGDRRWRMEEIEHEYLERFRVIVGSVRSTWGAPLYEESPVPSFPFTEDPPGSLEEEMYWRGAVALAYWHRAGRTAFVCIEKQDTELPYCLVLGVKPVSKSAS